MQNRAALNCAIASLCCSLFFVGIIFLIERQSIDDDASVTAERYASSRLFSFIIHIIRQSKIVQ